MPAPTPIYGAQGEQQLMMELWDPQLANNPLDFVRFVYPWGKPNTPLEHHQGPRGWQRETLEEITRHIQNFCQAVSGG